MGELVWAGGAVTAEDAFEEGDDFLDVATDNEACDALGVTGATAVDGARGDGVVVEFNRGALCTGPLEAYGMGHFFSPRRFLFLGVLAVTFFRVLAEVAMDGRKV